MTSYNMEELEDALNYAFSATGVKRTDMPLPKQLDEAAIELFRCSDVVSPMAMTIKEAINDLRIEGTLKFRID